LLEALGMALRDNGHDVLALAITTSEAVEAVREHQPDAVLLDLNFPDRTGLAAIRLMREVSSRTKVVMFSAATDHAIVGSAIAEGAHGFISKERPISEILDALQRACEGHMAVEAHLLQQALRPTTATDDPLWVLKFLTDREWEVMRCIMDGQTTEQMAKSLGVQRSTARTHVQNLLTKLGVHSRLQAAALMTAHATPETWPLQLR
jgi:two-component system, NarL family, nitrate/nitrite response regulator NarL